MQITKERLLKFTYEAIQEFEFEELTNLTLNRLTNQISEKLKLENFRDETIEDFLRLIRSELREKIERVLKEKYEPFKFKKIISENVIDSFLCQEFQLSYESSVEDFNKIIKEIENMQEKHVPKKAYLKSLRKWIKGSHILTSSEKIKLLDKVDNKISK